MIGLGLSKSIALVALYFWMVTTWSFSAGMCEHGFRGDSQGNGEGKARQGG